MVRSHFQSVDWVPARLAGLRSLLCRAHDGSDVRLTVEWGPHAERKRTSAATWNNPRRWNAEGPAFAQAHGHRPRVFCASLADWLDNQAPQGSRGDLLRLIRATPGSDWLLLTKRPENIAKMLPADGTMTDPQCMARHYAEDGERYRIRWPILSRTITAVVQFVCYEPAIAPLGPARHRQGRWPARIGLFAVASLARVLAA